MSGAIQKAWQGEVPLAPMFWLGFVIPAVVIASAEVPLFWLIALSIHDLQLSIVLQLLMKSPWYAWCAVSIVRIHRKRQDRFWSRLALIFVVSVAVLNVAFYFLLWEALYSFSV